MPIGICDQHLRQLTKIRVSKSKCRRVLLQKLDSGLSKYPYHMLKFREGDIQELLDLDLQRCHLVNQALPLTGKITKIRNQRRSRSLNQVISICKKKLGNDNSILLVRFGLPELHLHVIGNPAKD